MNKAWNGGRLRELREKAGLTRRACSEASGITEDGLYKLETGAREPSWGTLMTLADVLGVRSLDEFAKSPSKDFEPTGPGRPRGRPRKETK